MEPQRKDDGEYIKTFDIKLKTKPKDGVILQIHHTIRDSRGNCSRIRFSIGTFDDVSEKLACADTVGNIFILDFSDLKFWKLPNIGPCSSLHFLPREPDTLLAGTTKDDVSILDTETGAISLTLTGHTAPVKHISFSNNINKSNHFVTASHIEAILWEQDNFTKFFVLNTYAGVYIQQILFSPTSDYLVACFYNDTVQLWKSDNMKSVKQIIPKGLKHLKNVTFTSNGRGMAIAGLCHTLILFCIDTWKATKLIDLSKYGITGAYQISFLPQPFDGGCNKIIMILCNDSVLRFLDLVSMKIIYEIYSESSAIRRFVVSPTGKYFICILQLGEINVCNSSLVMEFSHILTRKNHSKSALFTFDREKQNAPRPIKSVTESKITLKKKTKVFMDSGRLRRILMQYGEYPEKFRSIIWASLLNTPGNKCAYITLVQKGYHSAYKDLEKGFTIHSFTTLKSLKRLLSCLAHWCPLFAVMKFLPGFVFPFTKMMQKSPLLLFECVATVILNNCQLWFEYAPFPPISILAMVENILGEHDEELLDHYCEIGITSQTYALTILETAFSEVLTGTEWLILWDHILSNEPAFLIMAVASYSIAQRNAIMKINKRDELENFFRFQNPICKNKFLKKIYVLLNETSKEIHPRRFFKSFTPLEKGDCYQKFTGYPKSTVCLKLSKLNKNKKIDNNPPSLKDLTTKSQEEIINGRFRCDLSGSKSSDEESIDNNFRRNKHKMVNSTTENMTTDP